MHRAWTPYSFPVFASNYYYDDSDENEHEDNDNESWNYNSFHVFPPLSDNADHAFSDLNNPLRVDNPHGHFPPVSTIESSRDNRADSPHSLVHAAETNHQLSNNLDQTDLDWIRAQEEYEYGDDESPEYEDDENEYSWEYITWNPWSEYVHRLDLFSTHQGLLENISNFRETHLSEFYSTNFVDSDGRGLSEDIIAGHLKTRSVNTTADEDHEMLCVVCQDCLFQEEDKIATLDCGHEYHEGCIKNWLMRKNSCPLCNTIGIRVNLEEN